jgi:hypothetical protein
VLSSALAWVHPSVLSVHVSWVHSLALPWVLSSSGLGQLSVVLLLDLLSKVMSSAYASVEASERKSVLMLLGLSSKVMLSVWLSEMLSDVL